jgi:pimeloyl-ACP methyl ester carboxylesterase
MLPRQKAAHERRPSTRWATFRKALVLGTLVTLVTTVTPFGLVPEPVAAAVPVNTSLTLHPCVVAAHAARCGALMVPEDRLTGTGPQVPIRVVVVPAPGPGRLADPIVWVAGGPGDSAVDMIQRVMPLFFFNAHRDLVFVDQRGTGGTNALTCPAFYSILPDLSDKAALRASVQQCLQHLKANLAFYTTAMAADDLNEVLGDLHYAKVNLLGISYGTTAEQVFLLRHPTLVRTMTLLSGTLLNIPVFERFPENGQGALDTVMAECARDASCHRAFPNLSSDWSNLWGALENAPIVVPASTSPSHQAVALTADLFASDLHELMAEPNTEAAVPLVIHTLAAAKERGAAVVAIAEALAKLGISLGPTGTQAMIQYPIFCDEPWARDQPSALLDKSSFEYHVDLVRSQWWQYICTLIPRSAPGTQTGAAETSPVPVLALNGGADPQDPPSNMDGAHQLWPNSLELAVPGQAHDINWATWQSCTGPLVGAFIARGTVEDLDTSCVASAHGQPFALTLGAITPGP